MEVLKVLRCTQEDKGASAPAAKNGWGGLCSQFFFRRQDEADFAGDCTTFVLRILYLQVIIHQYTEQDLLAALNDVRNRKSLKLASRE